MSPSTGPIPREVRAYLREAERRIEQFQQDRLIPAFVSCDFERTYRVLAALAESAIAPGSLFCEWGCGFGVVTCLAAMLDFDARGIEIETDLVEAAQQLAEDFGVPAEFVCGSFIPPGSADCLELSGDFAWLSTEEQKVDETDLGAADFDVIFAYPWPDEEHVLANIFERHAAPGALLVTYHGGDEFWLRRKKR
jgi:predicted O-methyltransferase YrrM